MAKSLSAAAKGQAGYTDGLCARGTPLRVTERRLFASPQPCNMEIAGAHVPDRVRTDRMQRQLFEVQANPSSKRLSCNVACVLTVSQNSIYTISSTSLVAVAFELVIWSSFVSPSRSFDISQDQTLSPLLRCAIGQFG